MRPKRISSTSVAYGLYGHGRFAPTRINPADAPTRRYKIPPPVPSSVLRGKEAEEVAWILRLPRVRRWAANWMRLVLLWSPSLSQFHASRESKRVLSRFPLSGPEILSNFDSSLGYPGEGPILLLVISAASWSFALCSLRPSTMYNACQYQGHTMSNHRSHSTFTTLTENCGSLVGPGHSNKDLAERKVQHNGQGSKTDVQMWLTSVSDQRDARGSFSPGPRRNRAVPWHGRPCW